MHVCVRVVSLCVCVRVCMCMCARTWILCWLHAACRGHAFNNIELVVNVLIRCYWFNVSFSLHVSKQTTALYCECVAVFFDIMFYMSVFWCE